MSKINEDGLMDSIGMIDSLILDCNELPKLQMTGQFVLYCARIVEMVKKLGMLKDGVKHDTEALQKQVEDLSKSGEEMANKLFQYEKGE